MALKKFNLLLGHVGEGKVEKVILVAMMASPHAVNIKVELLRYCRLPTYEGRVNIIWVCFNVKSPTDNEPSLFIQTINVVLLPVARSVGLGFSGSVVCTRKSSAPFTSIRSVSFCRCDQSQGFLSIDVYLSF